MNDDFEVPIGKELYVVKTGTWRVYRYIIDQTKCNKCGLCVIYCPTRSIKENNFNLEIDLEFCKGCGICMMECPNKAIKRMREVKE